MAEKIAFLFPGQGAQEVGMGLDFYEEYEVARNVFDEAEQTLGFEISELIFKGPESELTKTVNTQPAILTMSIAVNEVLKEKGIQADLLAGHSLGEYSALVAAGVLSFAEGVKLVRKRGEFMEAAVPEGQGAMGAIIGLSREKVEEVVKEGAEFGVVEVANYNTPIQTVISGEKEAVQKTIDLFKEAGAKRAISLPVSGPFHSSLMAPASEKLAAELEKIELNRPQIPLLANVKADYVPEVEEIRGALIEQLSGSVYWVDTIEQMIADGVDTFIEVGPGNTLKKFMKRIDRSVTALNINGVDSLERALKKL